VTFIVAPVAVVALARVMPRPDRANARETDTA